MLENLRLFREALNNFAKFIQMELMLIDATEDKTRSRSSVC